MLDEKQGQVARSGHKRETNVVYRNPLEITVLRNKDHHSASRNTSARASRSLKTKMNHINTMSYHSVSRLSNQRFI
jgi:hypothetical protein